MEKWTEDPYVKRGFLKKIKKTIKNFLSFYPNWLDYIQLTPTEQIKRRIADLNSDNIQQRTWFEDRVIGYKKLLEAQHDNEYTIKAHLNCVRSSAVTVYR